MEDATIWTEVERRMEQQVQDWEKQYTTLLFTESFVDFKARTKQTALALPADVVDKAMGHTKTVQQRLIDAKGWYIKG